MTDIHTLPEVPSDFYALPAPPMPLMGSIEPISEAQNCLDRAWIGRNM